MKRTGEVALVAAMLSACAGPSAVGQTTPVAPGAVDRIYAYEVPVSTTSPSQSQEQGPGWIQVSGTGSVTVAPDRARVSFAVETRAASAAVASGNNADVMDAVLAAIRGSGFDGLSLETFGYSLRPEYSNVNDQRAREIVAYTALNNVGATVEDVGAVGRVIDAAISAGANRVASIEVTGGAQRPSPQYESAGMALASRRADTPIEAGDQTVTASVSIRFALGPELGG